MCHHNKLLLGYFECLYGLGIICLFLIFQKNWIDNISSKNQKRQRLIAFVLVNAIQYLNSKIPHTLKNNIYHRKKRVPPPFFNSYINPVFGLNPIHSFEKTHVLVGTGKLTWLLLLNILSFNFFPTPNKFLLHWQGSKEAL